MRARFLNSYDAKHEIKMQGDNKATLIIGDNDYPFPVPLLRRPASGRSTLRPAALKFSRDALATTSSTRFRPLSPMSTPKTNTHPRIARAKVPGSTRNGS